MEKDSSHWRMITSAWRGGLARSTVSVFYSQENCRQASRGFFLACRNLARILFRRFCILFEKITLFLQTFCCCKEPQKCLSQQAFRNRIAFSRSNLGCGTAAKNHRKACRNLARLLYYGVDALAVDTRRGVLLWEQVSNATRTQTQT